MNPISVLAEDFGMTTSSRQRYRFVMAFGETKTVSDWARDPRCRVRYATLYSRIVRAGWNPELAIKTGTHRRVVLLVSPPVTMPRR
jgi:hypothetical protein